jgi:hypothetical protein
LALRLRKPDEPAHHRKNRIAPGAAAKANANGSRCFANDTNAANRQATATATDVPIVLLFQEKSERNATTAEHAAQSATNKTANRALVTFVFRYFHYLYSFRCSERHNLFHNRLAGDVLIDET